MDIQIFMYSFKPNCSNTLVLLPTSAGKVSGYNQQNSSTRTIVISVNLSKEYDSFLRSDDTSLSNPTQLFEFARISLWRKKAICLYHQLQPPRQEWVDIAQGSTSIISPTPFSSFESLYPISAVL